MKHLLLATALSLTATVAAAQSWVTYTTEESFDDVLFSVENAITDQGLVIDSISHVGDMLERTRADVGSDKVLFVRAEVYQFCSARLSRKVMEANPMNIAFCPYGIFVAELADDPGKVVVGYRTYPEGEMQEVQAFLDSIVKQALE